MARPVHRCVLVAGLLWLETSGVLAAGGHFDVDDAYVLDAGRCQYEAWLVRAPSARTTTTHLGPSCRVGPVELGLNGDDSDGAGAAAVGVGPQVKWVSGPRADGLSAGAAWMLGIDTRSGHLRQTLYAPLSWSVLPSLWLHLNAGIDRAAGATSPRYGASGEWAASPALTVIGERIRFDHGWTSRLGLRSSASASFSIDASVARVGSASSSAFTIGVNQEFGR